MDDKPMRNACAEIRGLCNDSMKNCAAKEQWVETTVNVPGLSPTVRTFICIECDRRRFMVPPDE